MFEVVENRRYAYADHYKLLAIVCKPTDRPAVAASLNRDFDRIEEWCNHWCIVMQSKKNTMVFLNKKQFKKKT